VNTTLKAGVPSALSQLVRRIVAPNPGLMTGPGTNTYLVGIDEVAVIDPGPDDKGHVDAIVGGAMKERVRWILLTHTHPDHWPAAKRLQKATGATLAAFAKSPKADQFDLKIDRVLRDGDVIEGTEFGLLAMHTPGHAPNHLCFFLEEERALFTGDHVLNGTTTVVNPKRGGDMTAYLESLERLRKIKRLARILPAHGDVIDEPLAKLEEYLQHRKLRERQILSRLRKGPARIPGLVEALYTDTPQGRPGGLPDGLVEMARRQVHAHLLKLKTDGKVTGTTYTAPWTTT
jgi:glyoxylase-like metal-dependent hydrolase (beta-lactamase superfamily II)